MLCSVVLRHQDPLNTINVKSHPPRQRQPFGASFCAGNPAARLLPPRAADLFSASLHSVTAILFAIITMRAGIDSFRIPDDILTYMHTY